MEAKPCTSLTKQVNNVHTRNIPDIQKDAEFIMEHLNDPNFDLSQLPSSIPVVEGETTKRYVGEDGNGAISINEWALLLSFPPFSPFQQNTIASPHILKCEPLYPTLMIPWCQSTPSACGSWEFSSPSWFLVWTRFSTCDVCLSLFHLSHDIIWSMYSQIHPYMFPVSLFRLHLCPWAMDWQPFSLPSNSKLLVISGPSIQAPFQSKSMLALQSWPVLAVKAPIQPMSSSHNVSSMVKPHPWASKSSLPLGLKPLAYVLVDFFVSL